MKIKIQELPPDRPNVILIRLTPGTATVASEREGLVKIRKALTGTNAIATTPEIDDERVLSLMFNVHASKNKKNKA